ncbi:hypothetical protein [Pendulispora albinea]|uniref:Porin n=1 Tax=Pendulispora albinea TaxID=2741071 RepID=A0ABZ2LQA4_9BACT
MPLLQPSSRFSIRVRALGLVLAVSIVLLVSPAAAQVAGAPPTAGSAGAPATGAPAGAKNEIAVFSIPVRFSGYTQADWVVFRQSSQDEVNAATGLPLNEDRFILNAARLRANVDHGLVTGVAEIDANTLNGMQVRPIDAEVSLRWPAREVKPGEAYFSATIGLFRSPFGFDTQEVAQRRPFLARSSFSEALFPGSYDLGLALRGGYRFFNYSLGIMNGDPIAERAFPGRDPNQSKDLLFRVGVESNRDSHLRVEAGFSGLTGAGLHKGTPATKDVFVWRDFNEDGVVDPTEIQVIAGAPATPSERFTRFAIGADLRLSADIPVLGELMVRGEIVRAKNLDRGLQAADPVVVGRDLREVGYYVDIVQEVTPYAMIGARYDRYNPDSDANEQSGVRLVARDPSSSTVSVMVAARYYKGTTPRGAGAARAIYPARCIVQYDHRTNALGRAASGAPTTLADDSLTVRGEVTF